MASQNRLKSINYSCPVSYNEYLRIPLEPQTLRSTADCSESVCIANECPNFFEELEPSRNSSAAFDENSEVEDDSNQLFKDSRNGKKKDEISSPLLKSIFERARIQESRNLVPDPGNRISVNQSFIPTSDRKRNDDKNQSVHNGKQPPINTCNDLFKQENRTVECLSSNLMFNQRNKHSTSDYHELLSHSEELENGMNMPDPLIDKRIKDAVYMSKEIPPDLGRNNTKDGPFSLMLNQKSDFNMPQSSEVQENEHASLSNLQKNECFYCGRTYSLPEPEKGDYLDKYSKLLPTQRKNHGENPCSYSSIHDNSITFFDLVNKDVQNLCSILLSDETSKSLLFQSLDILFHQISEASEKLTQLFSILFLKEEEHNQSSNSLFEDCKFTAKSQQTPNTFMENGSKNNANKKGQMAVSTSDGNFDNRRYPILADYDSIEDNFESLFDQCHITDQYSEQEKGSNHLLDSQIKGQTHFENKSEESHISYNISRIAIEQKPDFNFFIKQNQVPEDSSILPQPVTVNKNLESEIDSRDQPCFFAKKSEDTTSNKENLCLFNLNEGSTISSNKTRHFIANKNSIPESSSYNIPILSESQSEGSDDSFYNLSPFVNEKRKDAINFPDFLTQTHNTIKEGSDFLASYPHRYPIDYNGGLDALLNKTFSFPIRMSEISDVPSNNKLPFYKKKKNISTRFIASEIQGSKTGYESPLFVFSGNQESRPDDGPSKLTSNGNQGSKPGEPSLFVSDFKQESGVQFCGQFPFHINQNKAADVEYGDQSKFFISKSIGPNQHEWDKNSAFKPSFNIFVAGPENCGKIQLIKALTGIDIVVSKTYNSSCVAVIKDKRTGVNFRIWYVRNLLKSLLFISGICSREKSAILLVYNIVKYESLCDLDYQIKVVKGRLDSKVPIVLAGNKVDVRTPTTVSEFEKAGRPINFFEDGHKMKEKHSLQDFFECSGKTGYGVKEVFRRVAYLAMNA